MERLRALMLTAGLAVALGSGCLHVTVDGDGKVKSVAPELPGAKPAGDAAKVDPQVKPASASAPAAPILMPTMPSLPKFGGKDSAKAPAMSLVPIWQNRVAYLPDPTRAGNLGGGLVGQLFLFGPNDQFVTVAGKITIELYDETQKTGAPTNPEPVKLGQWVFDKETMARLVTTDERFGKCYALFLPWPTYKPDITRIRLSVRYEPEASGITLYAPVNTIILDNSVPGGVAPGGSMAAPLGTGGFSGPGLVPAGGAADGLGSPIPVGGGSATAAPLPPGLSPLVITAPGR